jgi:predicted metalloprotease with PDZ domain
MRALWQRYGLPGHGVPEDGIRTLSTELAGRPLDEFFDRYVDGTEDPPLAEPLARFGVRLELRPAEGAKDKGGKPGKARERPRCTIGARWIGGAELKLQHVFRDGPAARAGLTAGDTLVAVDGVRATSDSLDALLTDLAPGASVAVHAFRRDELLSFDLRLEQAPCDTAWLAVVDDADDATAQRRAAWIGG